MNKLCYSPIALALAVTSLPSLADSFTCQDQVLTPIYQLQGDGERSPLVPAGQYQSNESYFVQGVVTKKVTGLYQGFFIQDAQGDNNPQTSDGIFVYTGSKLNVDVKPGMQVCLLAPVKEHYQQTQLVAHPDQIELGAMTQPLAPTPVVIEADETLAQAMERYEGMWVKLTKQSQLTVTRNFGFDYSSYRNNMVLSHQAPLLKPTQIYIAGSEQAQALANANRSNQLYIDTDQKPANGVIPYFPDFDPEQGYIRVGDGLVNLEGVIGFSYNNYRLLPTNSVTSADFIHYQDRTVAPEIVTDSNLKVASFNVLNFFTSASSIGGDLNVTCQDQADADASKGCNRGAKTEADFVLQRTKIVNALTAMDADIVGIMEMENNGFGDNSAIANLVEHLNAQWSDTSQHYRFIEIAAKDKNQGQYFGSDAIMVAMLYRPAKVTPKGDAEVIRMPEQHIVGTSPEGEEKQLDKYQRDSLLQSFTVNHAKQKQKTLTIVVNHLKSKGSGCYEDWVNGEFDSDPADLQGRCNAFRVSAAQVLANSLKKVKGDLLVIGDMNSYGMEDPIRVLTNYKPNQAQRKIMTASGTSIAGVPYQAVGQEVGKGLGLKNLATQWHGKDSYSYSFGGELGSLDHALANKSLAKKVVGIEDWHINSVENALFEYSRKYSGELAKSEGPYSASDHDPVIISLRYKMKQPGFNLTIHNRSEQPIYPVFDRWYWDSTKPWLFGGDSRHYDEQDRFLKWMGISTGDKVRLSVLAYGVYEVPCGYSPLKLTGKLTAVYNGDHCRIK